MTIRRHVIPVVSLLGHLAVAQAAAPMPDYRVEPDGFNASKTPDKDSFRQYLAKWHAAVPGRHKSFVKEVARLYGVAL